MAQQGPLLVKVAVELAAKIQAPPAEPPVKASPEEIRQAIACLENGEVAAEGWALQVHQVRGRGLEHEMMKARESVRWSLMKRGMIGAPQPEEIPPFQQHR